MKNRTILTARDLMTRSLIYFRPEQDLMYAMRTLSRRRISGAPVVDDSGHLVGVLSEADCLRAIASGEFYHEDHYEQAPVAQYMTPPRHTIDPDTGIYRIAQMFLDLAIRRLPVVEGDRVIGQVSRRDVLRGVERMRSDRLPRKRYPDYPADRIPGS